MAIVGTMERREMYQRLFFTQQIVTNTMSTTSATRMTRFTASVFT